MAARSRIPLTIAILFFFVSFVIASSPTLFCKCNCNSNSTIIDLNGPLDGNKTSTSYPDDSNVTPRGQRTCNDCNRQFCLFQNLPFCEDSKEEEIFATCFQRDSTKDQAVVYTFMLLTVGLLAYAAVKPYLDKRRETSQHRGSYSAVSPGQGGG